MLCGRVPIIFDSDGGDGLVNSDNLSELMKKNFSGKHLSKKTSGPDGKIIRCHDLPARVFSGIPVKLLGILSGLVEM